MRRHESSDVDGARKRGIHDLLSKLHKWEKTPRAQRDHSLRKDDWLALSNMQYLVHIMKIQRPITIFGDATYSYHSKVTEAIAQEVVKCVTNDCGFTIESSTCERGSNRLMSAVLGQPHARLSSLLGEPYSSKREHCSLLQRDKLSRLE